MSNLDFIIAEIAQDVLEIPNMRARIADVLWLRKLRPLISRVLPASELSGICRL